jgi:hypothetical protein
MANPKETVLVIPDTQYPFAHEDSFDFLSAVKRKYKPTKVVHIGDEADFHALGDWDHDPDGMSPGDELRAALADMKKLYSIFPEVMACTSNHTARPFRRAFKHGIPAAFLRDYHEFLQAPSGWRWADYWEIDGVKYEHGEGQSGALGALKAALGNMQSTVIGHLHSFAGITYNANPKFLIFGFNVGCLIDRKKYAFAYGKNMKNKPILGAGIVNKGIPVFVPMLLNKKGKWVGRL